MNDNRHLIEIKDCLGKGKGIFAKENIPAATLVLSENSLLEAFGRPPGLPGLFVFSSFTSPEEIRARHKAAVRS
jgi:hypothetical protein